MLTTERFNPVCSGLKNKIIYKFLILVVPLHTMYGLGYTLSSQFNLRLFRGLSQFLELCKLYLI